MPETLIDTSKRLWSKASLPNSVTFEEIQVGALQRIATATEKMAQSYGGLIDERNRYKDWHDREQERRRRTERSNIALRGVITKLRKKLK